MDRDHERSDATGDSIEARLEELVEEHASMAPDEETADLAEQWRQMPDAVRRFAMSINRYVRLQRVGAPAVIMENELGILRPRITALRDYLDVLEESVKE